MQKKYVAIILLFFFLISMISILGSPLAAVYHRIPTDTSTTITSDKIRFYVSDPTGTEPAGLALTYNNLHGSLSECVFVFESDTEFIVYPGTRTDLVVFTGTRFVLDSDYLDSYYANEEPGTTVFNMHLFFVPVSGSSLEITASYSVGLIDDPTDPDENKIDILVLSTEPQTYKSVEDQGKVYLYLDSDTPLTVRYMMENKDYYLYFSDFKFGVSVYLGDEENYICHATSSDVSLTLNYLEFEPAFKLDPDSSRWDKPIVASGYKTIMPSDFVVSASESDGTDPTDPTDPTEPSTPSHGGGGVDVEEEDNSGLISGIVDGIGGFFEWIWDKISTFFSDLFEPITDFIAQWKERLEAEDDLKGTIFDAFGVLWEKLKGYTMEPILDFFDSVLNVEAIALVMTFWEMPILKDFSMAAVVVLVIIAFFILAITI